MGPRAENQAITACTSRHAILIKDMDGQIDPRAFIDQKLLVILGPFRSGANLTFYHQQFKGLVEDLVVYSHADAALPKLKARLPDCIVLIKVPAHIAYAAAAWRQGHLLLSITKLLSYRITKPIKQDQRKTG